MKRILLAEDNTNLIIVLNLLFRNAGYDLKVVQDGVEAIDTAHDWGPDLIILDIKLPKMNGFLVLETLQEDEKTMNIPVLVLSAKAEEEDIKKANQLGATDYITKPVEPDKLLGIIRKYI